MISSYGDQSTTRNILHIIIVLHQRCLNCSGMFPRDTFMSYTCNYNIRVTHRNGAIKHIFYTNQIHGGIISRLFFIHSFCRSMRLLFIQRLKYYFKSFCMKIEHVGLTYICRLYFPPECQQDCTLLRNQYYYENIPNIWHKSSTKHKEVRPDWNDKNDNANYAPSYHMEGFTNGSGCHF